MSQSQIKRLALGFGVVVVSTAAIWRLMKKYPGFYEFITGETAPNTGA